MARATAEQELLPSLLDRLLDDHPDEPEPLRSSAQKLRDLQQTIKRDLEDLLNTRCRCEAWPEHLTELKDSLVNYGLPDFMSMNLNSNEDKKAFYRMLQETISRWEPRLDNIKITLLDKNQPLDKQLRFRIDALLRVEPHPEPIVFDSTMEPITGNFTVTGER